MSLQPAFHESLPYIDPEPDTAALDAARALIAAEQANPSHPQPPPPTTTRPLAFSPLIQIELDRLAAAAATTATDLAPSNPATKFQPRLDLTRYEAQDPPSPTNHDAQALRNALAAAYTSSTYLSARSQNLELLDKHGKNAWLIGNHQLEGELKVIEKELAETKRDIDIVNLERRRRQEEVKGEMLSLEENWKSGVGRVLETEIAVEELRTQIREELRRQ